MSVKDVEATVHAYKGGEINWAVLATGSNLSDVHTMQGSSAKKSVVVQTDEQGKLTFDMTLNAFPGTAWELKMKEATTEKDKYANKGVANSNGIGRDSGTVDFNSHPMK
jgi:uncharacterized GH25 family protein